MIANGSITEGKYEYAYQALCDLCYISSVTIYSDKPLTNDKLCAIIVETGWVNDHEFDEFRCLKCDIKNYWITEQFQTILRL